MSWKKTLLTAALGGAVLLGGVATAQAHDRHDRRFNRFGREEFKLKRDIARHGFFSRQADHRRSKLRWLLDRDDCRFDRRNHRGHRRGW